MSKFEKVYKDDKTKKELKAMMVLEILAISVANYFTSTPELFRPSPAQITAVRQLISTVHQNFLIAAELILAKLPDNLQNNYATQLGNVLKVKRGKKQQQQQ